MRTRTYPTACLQSVHTYFNIMLFVAVSILLLSLPQTMYLKANGYPESWDLHDLSENPILRLLSRQEKW